ncbi:MAG: hypothetical protein U0821_24920 [Chloroflexota bacterium]
MTNDLASGSVSPAPAVVPAPAQALDGDERKKLSRFKWRYRLETSGFSAAEAERLIFFKWLYCTRPLRG